jgi:hypothetical protein
MTRRVLPKFRFCFSVILILKLIFCLTLLVVSIFCLLWLELSNHF